MINHQQGQMNCPLSDLLILKLDKPLFLHHYWSLTNLFIIFVLKTNSLQEGIGCRNHSRRKLQCNTTELGEDLGLRQDLCQRILYQATRSSFRCFAFLMESLYGLQNLRLNLLESKKFGRESQLHFLSLW